MSMIGYLNSLAPERLICRLDLRRLIGHVERLPQPAGEVLDELPRRAPRRSDFDWPRKTQIEFGIFQIRPLPEQPAGSSPIESAVAERCFLPHWLTRPRFLGPFERV